MNHHNDNNIIDYIDNDCITSSKHIIKNSTKTIIKKKYLNNKNKTIINSIENKTTDNKSKEEKQEKQEQQENKHQNTYMKKVIHSNPNSPIINSGNGGNKQDIIVKNGSGTNLNKQSKLNRYSTTNNNNNSNLISKPEKPTTTITTNLQQQQQTSPNSLNKSFYGDINFNQPTLQNSNNNLSLLTNNLKNEIEGEELCISYNASLH